MVEYTIHFAKDAEKQKSLIKQSGLEQKVLDLFDILEQNPFQNPPPFEKLKNNLSRFYSRRINIQHRLVYEIDIQNKIVKVLSMWSHYETL
jgi:Txe/YoeB family toxin of toxin-antitoxin system